jgi:AcrR family transcriptional regulator
VAAEPSRRQREIVAAARELLEREGVEGLTVGALAGVVGIKPPSLYKHFDGKRAIELALIADGLVAHAEAMEATSGDFGSLARAYRAFAIANPQLYRLMTERPLPRDELPEGLEARAAAPLQRALGGPDRARAAWACAHGLVSLELAGRFPADADLDAAWRAATDAFAPVAG